MQKNSRSYSYSSKPKELASINRNRIKRILISGNANKLEKIIREGRGYHLIGEFSSDPKIRSLLKSVPFYVAVIREIHRAAIENDVNTLTTICHPPVPAVILKSQDDKGITALHKACGLGNGEVIAYILQTYPRAIHSRDNGGRTPTHYAAMFKSELVYEQLLKAGANEHLVDKRSKTAKCYRYTNMTDEIYDVKSLHVLPVSPYPGLGLGVVDTTFDWNIFDWDDSQAPNGCLGPRRYTDLLVQTNEPRTITSAVSAKKHSSRPDTSTSASVQEEVAQPSNMDRLFEPETPEVKLEFVEQADSLGNETTNSSRPGDGEGSDESGCDGTTAPCVDAENGAVPRLASRHQDDGATHSTPHIFTRNLSEGTQLRAAVENALRNENLEEIGDLVLAGHGERLLHVRTENPTIRELIRHLPVYLTKIELIHRCCDVGNVEELRKHLDRRKLAVARERVSKLFLTPLHAAVAQNRMEAVRYLGGRFPETLHQADKLGRTPLHYAAMRADGQFAYHTLLTLGADKDLKDHNGHSAQFYYDNPEERYREELSAIMQKLNFNSSERNVETQNTLCLVEDVTFDKTEGEHLISGVIDGRPSCEKSAMSIRKEVGECDEPGGRMNETNGLAEVANVMEAHSTGDEGASLRLRPNSTDSLQQQENESPFNYHPATNVFLPMSRDKYGRTAIHLVASKIQSRNLLLQMLQDLKADVAYRDEFYRTARDIAALSRVYENVKAIDAYVVHMAANGENDKIMNLLIDGYDHILETETEENIFTVVERRNQQTTLTILKTVQIFELLRNRLTQDVRERLHSAVRRGDKIQVMEMLGKCGKDAALMAVSKNEWCRCSLHIAILAQRMDIVKYLAKKFPTTLQIGDNLERTPLHYAMALEKVEEFSTILIRNGAQRTAKDLKGRQPTYYFMNKEEIIRMQQEETYYNQNMENRPPRKL